MERNGGQPYGWWFASHNTSLGCSPWLHSALSELNEKTRAMLSIVEEKGDTFAERVDLYYEKKPQLVSLVEDLYRSQRSLVEQIDHLRHHVCTRSYKSCNVSFSSKDPSRISDESDADDFLSDVCHEDQDWGGEESTSAEEIERLKEENMAKEQWIRDRDKAIEELRCRLIEMDKFREGIVEMSVANERCEVEMKSEAENQALNKFVEELGVARLKNEEQRELLEMKDEEKRDVIRQLSVAVDLLKGENVILKKRLKVKRGESSKLQIIRELFNC